MPSIRLVYLRLTHLNNSFTENLVSCATAMSQCSWNRQNTKALFWNSKIIRMIFVKRY